tara:strand:- start:1443 stop:1988 length:546 start_codon:yes stop_codon:yes gene_type:complete
MITQGSIDLTTYPILSNFTELTNRIKQDNKCTRNYKDHIATWYGAVDYAYTGTRHKAQPLPEDFRQIAYDLEKKLEYENEYFNSLLINSYAWNKGIAPHSDDEPIFIHKNGTIGAVATISLGGTANITITNKYNNSDPYTFSTCNGDIYIMPEGNFQRKFKHAASATNEKPRISLTFRHLP